MLDLTFRCFSRARWFAFGVNRNIIAEDTQNPGTYLARPGFDVDEIGAMEITPAVMDANGVITTPAVMDTWWTVNVRISGKAFDADDDDLYTGETDDGTRLKFLRSKIVKFIRDQSTPVNLPYKGDTIRAYQFGTLTNRIQILDPRDWQKWSPRIFLGGMSY